MVNTPFVFSTTQSYRVVQFSGSTILFEGGLTFDANSVEFETLSERSGMHRFKLTAHEAKLLKYLSRQKGHIVSRSELLQAVWNEVGATDTRTVDNFIMRLREYFEPHPSRPVYSLSVRGAGYRFVPDGAALSPEHT